MKRFFFISFSVPVLAVLFSFLPGHEPKENISTWILYYNDRQLISSRDFLPSDTSAGISLKISSFRQHDSVKFVWWFDVLGGYKYNTRLYLGAGRDKRTMVSEKETVDVAAGAFSSAKLKEISSLYKTGILEFQCSVDKQIPRTLVKIKIVD